MEFKADGFNQTNFAKLFLKKPKELPFMVLHHLKKHHDKILDLQGLNYDIHSNLPILTAMKVHLY